MLKDHSGAVSVEENEDVPLLYTWEQIVRAVILFFFFFAKEEIVNSTPPSAEKLT